MSIVRIIIVAISFLFFCAPETFAARHLSNKDTLSRFLAKSSVADIYEGADGYGKVQNNIPVAPILKNQKTIGYVFLNTDFSRSIGYSGKPIYMLVGLDLKGHVTGAKLVKHSEPIILAGIPERKITAFIDRYKGLDIVEAAKQKSDKMPPIVSGATVTVLIIDESIRRSAIKVARLLRLGTLAPLALTAPKIKKTVRRSFGTVKTWQQLRDEGSVQRLRISVGEINAAFAKTGNKIAIARPELGQKDDVFIDLYIASLAVSSVAESLLGSAEYANFKKQKNSEREAFLIMGNGRYSFKGSGYVRGGIFGRIQMIQNDHSMRFFARDHKRLGEILAKDAPKFSNVGLFVTPKGAELDPAQPWRLQLLVHRAVGAIKKVFVTFDLPYQLPKQYLDTHSDPQANIQGKKPNAVLKTASKSDHLPQSSQKIVSQEAQSSAEARWIEEPSVPLWQRMWTQKSGQIIILCSAIAALTLIFFFQNFLVLSAKLTEQVRTVFLLFTLLWIGFYAQAQISVVNVFVFANALLSNFRWDFFLMEPLIFILWCSVVVSVLFWGRGAFCGWLCPFGALQELVNKAAKWGGIRQITVPWGLHERLWPLKYLIFLALLGLSLYSLQEAEHFAEIEPFKTAIVLHFNRSWPYILFVVALLGAGLFIERFYCRYLCPLGAALAIPARMAMFQWLKRYRNCGDPCHLCARDCMVQAIDPLGDINPNECLNCLNCQQMYYNDKVCPVVIFKKAKEEKNSQNTLEIDGAKALLRRPRRLGRARAIEGDEPDLSTSKGEK